MALGENQAQPVRAGGKVYTRCVTFDQHAQSCSIELLPGDGVPARVRYIEACIHIVDQRVRVIDDTMGKHAPCFDRLRYTFLPVVKLKHRVCCKAGTECRGNVFRRPCHHAFQGFPERLVGQFRANDVGAGDNQGIQPFGFYFLERLVIALDVGLRLGAAFQFGQCERVHVELCDRIAFAHQPEELALGG